MLLIFVIQIMIWRTQILVKNGLSDSYVVYLEVVMNQDDRTGIHRDPRISESIYSEDYPL